MIGRAIRRLVCALDLGEMIYGDLALGSIVEHAAAVTQELRS